MAHINQVIQFFGIVADILVVSAIIYVVIVLKLLQRKFSKSEVLLQFERKKRDDIFQQSLFILAIAILFRFLMENGDAFLLFGDNVMTALYIASKIFLVLFVIMIMRTTSETKH
ncbi:hypothetical protein ACFL96_06525 [Thermoproteota archaeon]